MYRILFYAACVGVLFTQLFVGAAKALGPEIGWYFDENASVRCAEGGAYSTIEMFLVVKGAIGNINISGWELKTTISGNCATTWDIYGTHINLLTPPEFTVGIADTLASERPGMVILAKASLFLLDELPINIYVGPHDFSAIPDSVSILFRPTSDIVAAIPSSGDYLAPVASINSNGWPCGVAGAGGHDVIVYVEEGMVEISNPSGGDFFGNVDIHHVALDSLCIEYQVSSVRNLISDNGRLNLTTYKGFSSVGPIEPESVFVFSLPDTSAQRVFCENILTIEGGLYAEVPRSQTLLLDLKSIFADGSGPCRTESLSYPNDPHFPYYMLAEDENDFLTCGILEGWPHAIPMYPVTIGLIDTGIDVSQEEISGVFGGTGYPLYPPGTDWSDPAWLYHNHGTNIAGILAANTNNLNLIPGIGRFFGIFNIYDAGLYDPNVIDMSNKIYQCMENNDLSIVSHLWASHNYSLTHRRAVAHCYNSGRLIIGATGNDGEHGVLFPAAYSGVIATGTINSPSGSVMLDPGDIWWQSQGGVTVGSNFGPEVDFVTATTSTASIVPIGAYSLCSGWESGVDILSGTSGSAGVMTGVAGLLFSHDGSLYNDDVYNIIRLSCNKVPEFMGEGVDWTETHGYGVPRVDNALAMINEYPLEHNLAWGISRVSTTNLGTRQVYGWPNWGTGPYIVKRHECEYDVVFPIQMAQPFWAWGVGFLSSGTEFEDSSPMEFSEIAFSEVVEGSINSSGCTLRTYVYEFNPVGGGAARWYPGHYNNLQWCYSLMGNYHLSAVEPARPNAKEINLKAWPNPANPGTTIQLSLPVMTMVSLTIYDVAGRRVRDLVKDSLLEEGSHDLAWNGWSYCQMLCMSS